MNKTYTKKKRHRAKGLTDARRDLRLLNPIPVVNEKALKMSERQYRDSLDSMGDAIHIVDRKLRLLLANKPLQQWNRALGLETKIVGKTIFEVYPFLRDEVCKEYRTVFESGKALITEERNQVDGRQIITETRKIPIYEGGKVSRVITVIRDITDHKRADDALKQSQDTLALVLDSIEADVYIGDMETYEILFMNKHMKDSFGHDLVGKRCYQVFRGGSKPCPHCTNSKLLDADGNPGGVIAWEGQNPITGRWYLNYDRAIRWTGGRFVRLEVATDITERKQAEEALRKSQQLLRSTFISLQDAIFIIDAKTVEIIECNPAASEIFGYSRDELVGKTTTFLHIDETSLEEFRRQLYAAAEKQGFLSRLEFKMRRNDGTVFSTENSVVPLKDEQGKLTGWVSVVRDITERKSAEEALRESEERYRTILENIEDGYYETDLPGNLTFFNDSLCRILGYSKDEMMGMSNKQYTDEENRKKLFAAFNEVYRTGKPAKGFDWWVFAKDGRKLFGEVSVSLMKDSKGEPIGFRGIARDVTERKQAEEALRTEKQRFETLLENAPFGMVMIDKDGTFKYVNTKFVELFGYDLNEVPHGREWFRKAYPDPAYRHQVISTWINDLKSSEVGEKRARIFEVTCKDGARKIINFIPVQLETGQHLISMEDITALQKAEEEKAALAEQLRQSQKMEAIGRLAGGIAHDFNNLLTVIRGYSQLSLMDVRENEKLKANLDEIQKATQRASDLTHHLLAFSRRQIMEMKILDLNTLLRDLDKMLHRVIGEDIELTYLLSDDIGKVRVDPGQMEQVILNLAVNARDAMPSGGKLTIETSTAELDEAYAHTHVGSKPGHYVMMSVSDTGLGMSPEIRERAFEPFFTTKEKGKGTGLGLSTCYGIVKQSGGNIWAYSEPGRGTTFKIYLPRVAESLKEAKEEEKAVEILKGTETILAVEDEIEVRKLVAQILTGQGYKVIEASDGEEAAKVARENGGKNIDLLLTDVVMPGMSGRELAGLLAIQHPKMKVLYMSGYTDNAIVHHGVLEEGVNYIQKPFTLDALARKVREVLDQRG